MRQFIAKKEGDRIPLHRMGSWPPFVHAFDEDSVWAINASLASGRPLLVRGEPGTGKSQLARAAAVATGRAFIYTVITSRTEGLDLLWRFDAVARLAQAQVANTPGAVPDCLKERHYVQPGPLWWAYNWESAAALVAEPRHCASGIQNNRFWQPDGWKQGQGCVLLIDEIDKADVDVPNSLLECLGNDNFTVPYLNETIVAGRDAPPPRVIITTNEERELPRAFVRRCMVVHLALPAVEVLAPWLVSRGAAHFPNMPEKLLDEAAQIIARDRAKPEQEDGALPGQAEYLDMLRAVNGMVRKEKDASPYDKKEEDEALAILKKINKFALNKKLLERP